MTRTSSAALDGHSSPRVHLVAGTATCPTSTLTSMSDRLFLMMLASLRRVLIVQGDLQRRRREPSAG